MKPIIGVIGAVLSDDRSFVWNNYIRSIEGAGGMPILLPYTEDAEHVERFAAMCDGFLFTGGLDIEPKRYGEEKHEKCGEVCPARDRFEFFVFPYLLATKKPILGICRGCQLLNVALGGTLYQDIPDMISNELIHRQGEPHCKPSHNVQTIEGTPLFELVGGTISVNSLHHQSVKMLGNNLDCMALASDGVMEAFYHKHHKFLWGIQWHPERSVECDENSRKIFGALVDACKRNA